MKEFKPTKSFIAFLGPIHLYYDFALGVKSNLVNSKLLIFHEQPNNPEFQVYLKPNKMERIRSLATNTQMYSGTNLKNYLLL